MAKKLSPTKSSRQILQNTYGGKKQKEYHTGSSKIQSGKHINEEPIHEKHIQNSTGHGRKRDTKQKLQIL